MDDRKKPPRRFAASGAPSGSTRRAQRSVRSKRKLEEDSTVQLPSSKKQRVSSSLAVFPPTLSPPFSSKQNPRPLSTAEAKLWSQALAAKYAAENRFLPCLRKLGVISRLVESSSSSTTKTRKQRRRRAAVSRKKQYARPPTKSDFKKQAKSDALREGKELSTAQLDKRAQEIQFLWESVLKRQPEPGWDSRGELIIQDDPNYISSSRLLEMFQAGLLVDETTERDALDGGDNPSDMIPILESLVQLSSTKDLWKVPLIVSYPILMPLTSTQGTGARYQLQIGVYCHRLLFETMTQHQLRIIMSALDQGSYRMSQPLHMPPSLDGPPVFASNPNQVVVFDENEMDNTDDDDLVDSSRDQSKIFAFTNKGFLKMIESHGNDISNYPQIQRILAPVLQVELLLHQIHGICWMVQMEQDTGAFGINSILWQEREFEDGNKYYYCPTLGQARLDRPSVMKGGLLCDEMGLGKTIQVLGLILATLDELKKEAASKPRGAKHKHATLIVVPPALVSQWFAEISKVTGDALVYDFFDAKTRSFQRISKKQTGQADIVVTTYNAFEKGKRGETTSCSKIIMSNSWGRVVLDEMQEIRSSTTEIAKNCEGLQCDRRWMLSGTPLFDGVEDLRGELNFLRLEPFSAASEDGFFDFAIKNHWEERSLHGLETLKVLSLVMLRRSKDMTICSSNMPLLGLKPLTITFEPVPQDPSERALYCFMEYLVHATINRDGQGDHTKNRSFIRLLRELCVSPTLLNGGLGCASQLAILNRLMIAHNRYEHAAAAENQASGDAGPLPKTRLLSCDEAISWLSQVEDTARVGEGFETSLTMGVGGGAARRDRANDSPEQQYEEARNKAARAARECGVAQSKRAVARWHWALEGVTTGMLPENEYTEKWSDSMTSVRRTGTDIVAPTFQRLWRWRSAFVLAESSGSVKMNLPSTLIRGWRPSESFFGQPVKGDRRLALRLLHSMHPEFTWAHPFSLLVERLPLAVTDKELHDSILSLLEERLMDDKPDQSGERLSIRRIDGPAHSESRKTVIRFSTQEDYVLVSNKAKSATGIRVLSAGSFPWIDEEIASAKKILEDAEADSKFHPSSANLRKEAQARKAYKSAQIGLRICTKEKYREGHVLCGPSFDKQLRTVHPKTSAAFYARTKVLVEEMSAKNAENTSYKVEAETKMARLSAKLSVPGVSEKVLQKSVSQTLHDLKEGKADKDCYICLESIQERFDEGKTFALTRCGHIFCAECLNKHRSEFQHAFCPVCRNKDIAAPGRFVHLDLERTKDKAKSESLREKAKAMVRQAVETLDASNGKLDPHLWEALYLASDLPPAANQSIHSIFTGIPGHVLAHIRHATGMPVHLSPGAQMSDESTKLSSKVRALLSDLPSNEKSVVFASSKQVVKHLLAVFDWKGIECRSLFTGQSSADSERAVSEWQSSDRSVLVVQAGAAACGLTLTAASKMFLLEPLIKYEEEQQAYARLHRFGQEHAVECKVYYTPVSVENRLLDWRKRAERSAAAEETTVYAPMRVEAVEDDEMEELDQTRFLLGLEDENCEEMDDL